jgi:hypothetical protein
MTSACPKVSSQSIVSVEAEGPRIANDRYPEVCPFSSQLNSRPIKDRHNFAGVPESCFLVHRVGNKDRRIDAVGTSHCGRMILGFLCRALGFGPLRGLGFRACSRRRVAEAAAGCITSVCKACQMPLAGVEPRGKGLGAWALRSASRMATGVSLDGL